MVVLESESQSTKLVLNISKAVGFLVNSVHILLALDLTHPYTIQTQASQQEELDHFSLLFL